MWQTNETRKYMSPNIIVANWLSYAYNGDKKLRWQTNHLFNTIWPEENPRRTINLFSLDFSMYIHKILVYWDYVGSGKKYLIWKILLVKKIGPHNPVLNQIEAYLGQELNQSAYRKWTYLATERALIKGRYQIDNIVCKSKRIKLK